MSPKFSGPTNNPPAQYEQALTHEGGMGYLRSPRKELFLQAVTEMAEDTYYESASARQTRMAENVRIVVAEAGGWEWLCNFATWLRRDAGMRSASVMVAAETVAASGSRLANAQGLTPRELTSVVCFRADEPAEMLGYWLTNHGRQIPSPLKRGIADAAVRLYNERNALKYDGQSRSIRMGDVIELTHPTPKNPEQSALFKFLIDRRHNRDDLDLNQLPMAHKDYFLMKLNEEDRLRAFEQGVCQEAGWSWERVAGWLPGGLTAQAWETMIPSMGYMALLRNLRNFDQAVISKEAKNFVKAKLANPEEVARSMQFPYRFFSAWQATGSMTWGSVLEEAMELSTNNIPEFGGRTLILVDTSGSMQSSVGGAHSQAMRCDVAALFGAALASKNMGRVDLAIYAITSAPFFIQPGSSILRVVEAMKGRIGSVGHGTNTWQSVYDQYKDHDRVIVLTDEQSHDSGLNPGCFMHFINLAGYKVGTGYPNGQTFSYGGFTDSMFRLLPILEAGVSERWPWE